jgi:hypothetical protein
MALSTSNLIQNSATFLELNHAKDGRTGRHGHPVCPHFVHIVQTTDSNEIRVSMEYEFVRCSEIKSLQRSRRQVELGNM